MEFVDVICTFKTLICVRLYFAYKISSSNLLCLLFVESKVVPVLNQVPRHEDVMGSGGIAPYILNLGNRWM
jgi:hypothetical protein